MNTENTLAFRLNLTLMIFAILLVTAGGLLGMVYMRVQIEQTALRIQESETKLAKLERTERYLDARIAQEQQPRELVARIRLQGLNLRPSYPEQVIHVHSRTPFNFNTDADGSRVAASPASITGRLREGGARNDRVRINVALIEPSRSP